MRLLIFFILISIGIGKVSFAQEIAFPRNDGYSAAISTPVCESKFENFKWTERSLGTQEKFRLFSFSAEKFDPQKPTLLFIHGGPGGIWGPTPARQKASLFPNYNSVFFHFRGGGCSSFPSHDALFDLLITSKHTLQDIEALREAWGINSWHAIVAFSYGTNIARKYAHHFPHHVGRLILEGLDEQLTRNATAKLTSPILPTVKFHLPSLNRLVPNKNIPQNEIANFSQVAGFIQQSREVKGILSVIEARRKQNSAIWAEVSTVELREFYEKYNRFLEQVAPAQQYSMAAMWNLYLPRLQVSFAKQGTGIPDYLNRQTLIATVALLYSGADSGADAAIAVLLEQFKIGHLSQVLLKSAHQRLNMMDMMLFPYLHSNYLEMLERQLVSTRVQIAMTKNDQAENKDEFCTDKPILVLNGTADFSTPAENVDHYLSNKACAKSSNVSLLIQGGGHSNMATLSCLTGSIRNFLDHQEVTEPRNCTNPVVLKKF